MDLLTSMRNLVGDRFSFDVLSSAQTNKLVPAASKRIAGAVFCPLDGHVSPLSLLRALFESHSRSGGLYLSGHAVSSIKRRSGGDYQIQAGPANIVAQKVVLAAGLGNRGLGAQLDLHVPVRPVRGQILITERIAPFLRYPTLHVRQTTDGSVQIGDSKEEVDFDDGTSLVEISRIARRGAQCFPCLAGVKVVRSWGALRVMSQDGLPIYAESERDPGIYVTTCHSGITLAPLHAGAIARWIAGVSCSPELSEFSLARFHVQTN